MNKFCCVVSIVLLLSGCALKRYPDSQPVSNVQASTLDCAAVTQSIAEQRRVQAKIDKTGEFDSLTVLGFLGDFGIGNGMAKQRAQNAASQRMAQLKNLQAVKCAEVGQKP